MECIYGKDYEKQFFEEREILLSFASELEHFFIKF